MKRGPKPKPTRLKQLTGNPGKRPLNNREPAPAESQLEPPEWLSKDARQVWAQLAPRLKSIGVFTQIDEVAFARYCTTLCVWHVARAMVEKEGVVLGTTGGNWIQHPAVGTMNSTHKLLCQLEAEFGMTPASRSRVRVEAGAAKLDPLDLFNSTN